MQFVIVLNLNNYTSATVKSTVANGSDIDEIDYTTGTVTVAKGIVTGLSDGGFLQIGALDGRVFWDKNKDGKYLATNRPVLKP